jgi:RND family efflux transporter MFP subunit
VLAHLDTKSVAGEIQQAEATVNQNSLQVQQAQIGAVQQREQGEASIEQAQAAVSNAEATLESDKAVLTGNEAAVSNAKQNLTRSQSLFESGLVAQKDVEAAQLAMNTAIATADAQKQTIEAQKQTVAGQEHALNAAKTVRMQNQVKEQDIQIARQQVINANGALRTARAQLSLYTLHAPLSGRVTAVGASLGEAVDTTTKLVTITNIDTLQLQISIPAASSSLVHPGQPVTFRADSYPGITFHTTIQTVGSQVDATTGAVTAFAIVPNSAHSLNDDQIVRVTITTDRLPGSLIVPKSAVLIDPSSGSKTVAVVDSDQVLHIRNVTTGLVVGDLEEVTNGLKAGETIAVSGQYAVPDNTKVSVVRGS